MNKSRNCNNTNINGKAGVLLFFLVLFSFNLRSQNAFYFKFGGIFGTSISTTTELNTPFPGIVEEKYGPVLGLSFGLSYLMDQFEIELETQMRGQNWFYNLNTPLAGVNLNFGVNILPEKKVQPILFSGVGCYYYLPEADVPERTLTIYEDGYPEFIILNEDFRNSYKNIPLNFDAGVRLIWIVTRGSSFHFTLKYNFGWNPYLFYEAKTSLVRAGSGQVIESGKIRARYDGSALLFSVSYGVNLIGLRQRLKEKMR